MIYVNAYKNACGDIVGFDVDNHGDPIVCSAVSALVLNAVNSVEALTKSKFSCDLDEEDGGFLSFELISRNDNDNACLLLKSLMLGLHSIAEQYPEELRIKTIKE